MNAIKAAFWNGQERRLRSGWRILAQFILFILVQIVLGVVGHILGRGPGTRLFVVVLYPLLGIGLIWLVARFVDRRKVADYGFRFNRGWWPGFNFGVVLGAVLMTGIFLTERLAGWISARLPTAEEGGLHLAGSVALSLVFYLTVALMEEFTSRGYQLRNLSEGLVGRRVGARTAIVGAFVMTSALFGLLHALNRGATVLSTTNIILAGALLALPYVLTGELGASIGLHLSWNFFQGAVYGFPVSGTAPSASLVKIEQGGPELWTGGTFGPEAGLLAIVATIGGGILTLAWVKSHNHRLALDVQIAQYEPREARMLIGETVAEALAE
jgi:membrane protease YdiL (CAAX protease family)